MSSVPSAARGFRLRTARDGDAEAITSLIGELGYLDTADAPTIAWVMSHPEMEIFIAADMTDEVVGLLTLSHRPQLRMRGRIATIDELVVTNTWQREGVGRALVHKALERAKELGVQRLGLTTDNGRGASVRQFYVSCGFSEVDAAVMHLDLADPSR
jgi:N-acetylglutamate synthase-like GNAT family acetyltransferase